MERERLPLPDFSEGPPPGPRPRDIPVHGACVRGSRASGGSKKRIARRGGPPAFTRPGASSARAFVRDGLTSHPVASRPDPTPGRGVPTAAPPRSSSWRTNRRRATSAQLPAFLASSRASRASYYFRTFESNTYQSYKIPRASFFPARCRFRGRRRVTSVARTFTRARRPTTPDASSPAGSPTCRECRAPSCAAGVRRLGRIRAGSSRLGSGRLGVPSTTHSPWTTRPRRSTNRRTDCARTAPST
jgi:hypothetical protein